jgi:hypothetical protein
MLAQATAGRACSLTLGCGCAARHRARARGRTLGDADAVLVIDETGFLKQGRGSCGVGLIEPLLAVLAVMTQGTELLTWRVLDEVKGRGGLPAAIDGAERRPADRVGVPCYSRGCFGGSYDFIVHPGLTPRRYQSAERTMRFLQSANLPLPRTELAIA